MARRPALKTPPLFVDTRADAEVLPLLQLSELRIGDGGEGVPSVLPQHRQRRRVRAVHDRQDGFGRLGRIARLGTVDRVVLFTPLAGRFGVVFDRRRRLGE